MRFIVFIYDCHSIPNTKFASQTRNLLRDYQPINETTKLLPLHLTFSPLSMFWFQIYMAHQMRNKWSSSFGMNMIEETEDEQDSVKEALLGTSPYLLALTVIVSITHSVFEFLAFKNGKSRWSLAPTIH